MVTISHFAQVMITTGSRFGLRRCLQRVKPQSAIAVSNASRQLSSTQHDFSWHRTTPPVVSVPQQYHRHHNILRQYSSESKSAQLHPVTTSDVNYCVDMLRIQDHINYLCTLLLDSKIRTAAFAIRAFNVEVAQISDSTREKLTAKMRFQFWRDAIDMVYAGRPSKHPVTVTLAGVVREHDLPQGFFHEMINARINDHENSGFNNIEEIEEYADQTISCVLMMIMQVGGVRSAETDVACCHVGRAMGLASVLRGAPHLVRQREIRLPRDLMIANKVSAKHLEAMKTCPELEEVVFTVASAANSHIESARRMSKDLPKQAREILLPTVACANYLEHLQKLNFDIFSAPLHRRDGWLPLTLAKNKYISKSF